MLDPIITWMIELVIILQQVRDELRHFFLLPLVPTCITEAPSFPQVGGVEKKPCLWGSNAILGIRGALLCEEDKDFIKSIEDH